MAKSTISSYLQEHSEGIAAKKVPGPYLTISCQWGCDGTELGETLIRKLNERDAEKKWRFYHKDLLSKLAQDTGLSEEILEKERGAKPSMFKDFLRGLKPSGAPDVFEIRNKITLMIRTIAFDGYAVILGQGGTAATGDLANGLSIRVMGPKEWRLARVCVREGLSKQAAAEKIEQVEEEKERLRAFYERQNPREPAFSLIFDNSVFSTEQIANMTLLAMEQKRLILESENTGKNT